MSRWIYDVWLVLPAWAVWALIATTALTTTAFVCVAFAWADTLDTPPSPAGPSNVIPFRPRQPALYDWAAEDLTQ